MTVFARNAFRDFKLAALLLGFCVKRVADKTFWRFFGFCAELENASHAFADVASESLISAAVFIFQDPRGIFGLEDATAGDGSDAAVAARGGARARTDVFHGLGSGIFCLSAK